MIRCIEIGVKDVYVEYHDQESEYLSFSKTKKEIFKESPKKILFSCCDHEKSVNFLNSLLGRYWINERFLRIRSDHDAG